jgi:4-amino-4-deoxy-L-arabinose transferase-like glycosyltransferase
MLERRRPTPARLTAEAAVRLPRVALLALLVAFLLPGLAGRDLWPEDASAFGRMWTMAHGSVSDWWLTNVAGLPTPQDGPLPFWPGAWAIRWLGTSVGEAQASRLSILFWFALATFAIWATVRRLARADAAQPLAPAFGREVDPDDYARMLADIAVLLFISTLGIVLTLHVTNADTAVMAIVAGALYGLALAAQHPLRGSLLAGLCAAAMALSRSPVLAATMLVGCEAGLALVTPARSTRLIAMAACAAVVVAVCGGALAYAGTAFAAASHLYYGKWAQWFSTSHGLPGTRDAIWLARNASWYVWPLWPLAAWSLYAWRHHWRAAHIGLPAVLLACLAIGLLASSPFAEAKFVPMIAPMAILAAFAVPALRRAPQQWVDWFGITIFTLFVLFIWVYFLAWINGSPRAMAYSVMRLIPGYTPDPSPVPLLVALAVTGFWVGLIVWRVHGRPKYAWRGAWLSAAGMTSLWLIAVALFLPAVNHNRSYRELAAQTGQRIGAGNCVVSVGVSAPIRAILAYEGSIHFAHEDGRPNSHGACRYALQAIYRRQATAVQSSPPPPPLATPDGSAWDLVWEGRRLVRSDESWRLWRLRRNQ